jgi:hypothetical protein
MARRGDNYVIARIQPLTRLGDRGVSLDVAEAYMGRSVIFALPVTLLVVGACGGVTVRWRPFVASQVPDTTPVRFDVQPDQFPVVGRALDWQRGSPRLIIPGGDTILIPANAKLEVRLKEKANHTKAGAILGFVVGIGVMYATCPASVNYCGEQNPIPVLGVALGGLIGSALEKDHWVRVRWDDSTRRAPPPDAR